MQIQETISDRASAIRYRQLTSGEIDHLEKQDCTAENWSAIEVMEEFDVGRVHKTQFSGKIKIGKQSKTIRLFGGVEQQCGIYRAKLHNCVIGNNVYINKVENYLANYIIDDDVVIYNIDLLAVEGASGFGNGTEAAVINEAGGREVPIYDQLSAQTAYILALYRHRVKAIEKLQKMIARYVRSVTNVMGRIEKGARLINCGTMKNIKVGPWAIIEGAKRLENGSVNSSREDPAQIGSGVVAENFIICSGGKVSDNTIIINCFVGQGAELARQYSAENSLFFANCGGYHGEACSIFAGPYTVTHHKSTLLIAGLYSFLNAGSGSNQSNHMYKMGPVHQGIVERGSKTTSNSYVLWPAKIGVFTLVMGRHYGNCDTSDLPYSYLIEHEDESVLVPGVNLRSVGTVRDARKWPRRDKRKGPQNLDLLIYNLLNPYTVQRMINGIALLEQLKQNVGVTSQFVYYNSVKIKRSSLDNGIRYYRIGVDRYLGNCLVTQLRKSNAESMEEIREELQPKTTMGRGAWIDIAGLIAPKEAVESLLHEIENGITDHPECLTKKWQEIYHYYYDYEWTWASEAIREQWNESLTDITADKIIAMIRRWIAAVETLDKMRCRDTEKEFAAAGRISFGVDDGEEVRDRDFEQVRGSYEDNDFIRELRERLECKKQTASELIRFLEYLK